MLKKRNTLLVLFGLFAAIAGWLIWRCYHDPQISFLGGGSNAEWITFPTAFDPKAHDSCRIDTIFRREFDLSQTDGGNLQLRAAKQVDLRINNQPVPLSASENWKTVRSADVTSLLRQGSNTIEARVVNDNAPPALWFLLGAGQGQLRSDESWESSCAGSPMKKVVLAARPRLPGSGNAVGETEGSLKAVRAVWPIWLLFGAIGLTTYGITLRWLTRVDNKDALHAARWPLVLIGLLALSWLALFWNNARLVPYSVGFDAQAHADYINYIQEHHTLPLPNQGYEMFQPPLYYLLSAVMLSASRLSVTQHGGVLLLRFLTTLLGIANFILVFLSARLLFPKEPGKQVIALLFAAFLPMQFYLSHFITNETLAATLMTAALFLLLRVARAERLSVFDFAVLGAVLGLALLTKSTAIMLIPPTLLACAFRPYPRSNRLAIGVRYTLTLLLAAFAVCGWYYVWIWQRFGRPIVGNWEPQIGFNWWQDPGFHTSGDYLRFGRSLVEPFFSSLYSFADGIYSTLWGDGLLSGTTSLDLRLPWNYDLMVSGYWLALLPTMLMIIGACVALRNTLLAGSLLWLILVSYVAAITLGFFYVTSLVASYAQVKAFYGLSMLTPLSALAALGWDVITRRRKTLQLLFGSVLLIFGFNTYAWAWIRPSATQHVYAGVRLFLEQSPGPALAAAEKAIQSDDMSAQTRALLALLLSELDQPIKALEQAKRAVELSPSNGQCHLQLARVLAGRGELEQAIREARTASELEPENAAARQELANFLLQSDSAENAAWVAKEGVALAPFNAELHYTVALAAARNRELATAASHFAYSLLLRKDWTEARNNLVLSLALMVKAPDATKQIEQAVKTIPDSPEELNELAWILATHPDETLRNGVAAIELAKRGCEITNYDNPRLRLTLAAAYAETNQFDAAAATAVKALTESRAALDTEIVRQGEQLLRAFKEGHAYRDTPAAP